MYGLVYLKHNETFRNFPVLHLHLLPTYTHIGPPHVSNLQYYAFCIVYLLGRPIYSSANDSEAEVNKKDPMKVGGREEKGSKITQ